MAKQDWKLRTDPIEEWEVEGIRDGYRRGYTMQQLARLFETTRQNISLIVLNKSHYDPDYKIPDTSLRKATLIRLHYAMGTIKKQKSPISREVRDEVRRQWWEDGMSCTDIALSNNLSITTVVKIIANEGAHEDTDYDPPTMALRNQRHHDHNRRFSDDDIRHIRKMYESGNYYQSDIANKYECSAGLISQIIRGQIYKHVSDE